MTALHWASRDCREYHDPRDVRRLGGARERDVPGLGGEHGEYRRRLQPELGPGEQGQEERHGHGELAAQLVVPETQILINTPGMGPGASTFEGQSITVNAALSSIPEMGRHNRSSSSSGSGPTRSTE